MINRIHVLAIVIIFFSCFNRIAYAQSPASIIANNPSLLNGFNEQKVLDSLVNKGVLQSEIPGLLKTKKALYILSQIHTSTVSSIPANHAIDAKASDPCDNMGFEDGDFNLWTGYTGYCCPISATSPGIVTDRHTIVSGAGVDPNVPINLLAPGGGTYSTRLGNEFVGGEAEKLVRTFAVTAQNTNFTYQYAVVLQDPGHSDYEQPRFEVKMYDSTGALLPCGFYSVTSQAGIPGFQTIDAPGSWGTETIRYKDWTTVGVDLSPYIGQNITIEFSTGDCSLGGHYGYAYIDASCNSLQITSTFCRGSTVPVVLTAPDGFTDYAWSNSAITQSITVSNPVAGNVYSVHMESVTGCPTNLTITLQEQDVPTLSVSQNATICQGAAINLTASGATTYSWTSSPAGFTSVFTNPTDYPIVNTDYFLKGSNVCGSSYDTVKVITKPRPIIDAGPDQFVCPGEHASLAATSNSSNISWTANSNLSCTTCLTPNVANDGTYYLNATNTANGCTATDTVVVTTSIATADAGNSSEAICLGDSIQLNGSGGFNYTWSPSTALSCTLCPNPVAKPLVTTKYKLTVSNTGSCSAVDSITINVNPVPLGTPRKDTSICLGQSVQFDASKVGATGYLWITGTNDLNCIYCENPVATPVDTTLYLVRVSNSFGCSVIDSSYVIVKPVPAGSAGPDQIVCPGSTAQLNASNTAPSTFNWTNSSDLSCLNCLNPVVTTASTNNYYFNITNSVTGCTITDTVNIKVNQPIANAGNDTVNCLGKGVQLMATGGLFFSWSPITNLSCTVCPNPIANPTITKKYYVTVSNVGGCFSIDSIMVNVVANPVANAGADQTVCAGTNITLTGTGGGSYLWSPSATLTCPTCASTLGTPLIPTQFNVTVTNVSGCSSQDSVFVFVKPSPTIDAGFGPSTCAGQTVNLFASTTAATYFWSPNPDLSCTNCLNATVAPSVPTTYYFNGVDGTPNHCDVKDSVTINVAPMPMADAGIDQTIQCFETTIVLNGSGGAYYSWSPTAGVSCSNCQSTTASPIENTTYILTVTDPTDCSSTDTVFVQVDAPAAVDFSMNYFKVCKGLEAEFVSTSSGVDTYTWDFGDGTFSTEKNPKHIFDVNSTYTVTLTGSNSSNPLTCIDSLKMSTPEIETIKEIFVPNTFSPNTDGSNDVFRVRGANGYNNFHFVVYNRWGKLVYETKNHNDGWDGIFESRLADPAVYAWYLEVSCDDSSEVTSKKGNVTLIR